MEMYLYEITQDDRNAAQRRLNMDALSPLELGALIERHRNNLAFASQVIASAARQVLAAKRAMVQRTRADERVS
jgi:hypothetical protein